MPGEAVPLLGGQAGAVEGVFPGSHDVDSIHFDSFRAAPGGSRRERRAMVLRAAGPPPVEAEHGAGQVRRDGGAAGGRLELLLVDLQEAGRVSRQAGDLRAAQAGAVDGVLPSAYDVDLVHGQVLLCGPALLKGSTGGAGLLLWKVRSGGQTVNLLAAPSGLVDGVGGAGLVGGEGGTAGGHPELLLVQL